MGQSIFGVLVLFAALIPSVHADEAYNEYFSIRNVTIEEIQMPEGAPVVLPPEFPAIQDSPLPPVPAGAEGTLSWTEILNTAKSLWAIVKEGKPVVTIKTDFANAIPATVKNWDEMSGWQAPVAKSYRITYQNGFGGNVVDFTFRVIFIPGGQYQGKGRYITNAMIVPASVDVAWGYTFNAEVKVASVTNAGSLKNPMAAVQLQLHWSVDTPLKHSEMTDDFYLRGDGVLITYSALPTSTTTVQY